MPDTEQSVTREEIKEQSEGNNESYPVFRVPHCPERKRVKSTDNGSDTDRDIVTDGGINVDAVREAVDYWVRSTYSESGRAIHIPAEESTRDEPETPCRHTPRAGRWRAVDFDHFDDDLLEERLCSECAAKALGEEYRPGGDDVDYSRTPLDRLADAGLLDEDDDQLRADDEATRLRDVSEEGERERGL